MRLTLVICSFGCGGAERAMSLMMNYWAERGKKVTLLTLAREEAPAYAIHPAIRHRPLALAAQSRNAVAAILRNVYRAYALKQAIRESKPDVVVSSMETSNVLSCFACHSLHIPVVVIEQIDPDAWPLGLAWSVLRRVAYPAADRVVSVSHGVGEYFEKWMPQGRCVVIPNMVSPVGAEAPLHSARDGLSRSSGPKTLVAMGRLVPQKGFDLLLGALDLIMNRHPEWRLKILGDGPLREELQQQASGLGLSGQVSLPGRVADPFVALRQADLFVLSSRFEGCPLALCEAMACGLPAVSFDCPSGPGEIIRQGIDGLLVPPQDVGALAGALDRLMGDAAERSRLARHAPDVTQRFGLPRVMGMWDSILAEIVSARDRGER
jgi:GalNAc-alpha-(1->4)-GalNAc-alpha-(1->3)-diNAcBac-PP-undecaprenol alpha-1,4-N-acetyl-D-galactosaminyltransferase